MLGRGELRIDGVPARFRSAKVIELLAFLANQPEQSSGRAMVAEALYPDSIRGRENLRQTLLYVSQGAPGMLQADSTSLKLVNVQSDISSFQAGDLNAYGGVFLPSCDSDWATAIRADLEQTYVQKLSDAAGAALTTDLDLAASLSKRAIQIDPYLEQPRRIRWRALEQMGERATAAAERNSYADFVRREVGIEVSASTDENDVAPSLSPSERLLRTIALAPEAFEHGRLVAVSDSLKAGIEQVTASHPIATLAWIALARVQFEIGETNLAGESIHQLRSRDLTHEQSYEAASIHGRVLARMGDIEGAEKEARFASNSALPEVRAESLLLLTFLGWVTGDYPSALEKVNRVIPLAEQAGATKLLVRALRSKASTVFRDGKPEEAIPILEEGLAHAARIGRGDLEAGVRMDLGRMREALGELDLARDIYRETIEHLQRTDFRVQFAQAVTYLGDLEHRLGSFEDARDHHMSGVAARRINGDLLGLATSLRGLGKAQLALGDFAGSLESLRHSLRLFRRFDESGSVGSVRIPLAKVLSALGNRDDAFRQAQQGSLDLANLREDEIMIRYNDADLLPPAIDSLINSLSTDA